MSAKGSPVLRALSQMMRSSVRQPTTWRPLPFLLPRISRAINTTSTFVENDTMPHDLLTTPPQQEIIPSTRPASRKSTGKLDPLHKKAHSPRYSLARTPSARISTVDLTSTSTLTTPTQSSTTSSTPTQLKLSPSILGKLPHLASQGPYYINIHLHGRPYVVTAGDTLRLPFLMHGVLPGDILRLDRASALGSRDWTLKAGLAPLDGDVVSPSLMPSSPSSMLDIDGSAEQVDPSSDLAPMTIYPPDRKPRFRQAYLDDRLFVCRAVVLGTESEPMRIKEKTKRRQRRVKKVKSKHRFTVLKIGEITLKGVKEVEALM